MKRLPTFLAGMLTMALVGSLGVGALAATGQLTITVDPVNIQVNGETFQPKDAKGNDVPVFAYNGTTYAPLRALAEAYGLEVGYDAQAKMATVGAGTEVPAAPPDTVTTKFIYTRLVKLDGKYYAVGTDDPHGGARYMLVTDGTESLLFADDISINTSGVQRMNAQGEYESFPYCSSWYFNFIIRFALASDYDITESSNPYLDGIINITSPNMTLDDVFECGVGETEYLSASTTFTPMWMEYNGARLYKHADKSDSIVTNNGIRYLNGMVCMNDVLNYFGINKTISVGEYSDTWYLEIK